MNPSSKETKETIQNAGNHAHNINMFDPYSRPEPVKSTSKSDSAFSHVQEAIMNQVRTCFLINTKPNQQGNINLQEGLCPQAQAAPVTGWFSVSALSQVHWPAGRVPGICRQYLNPIDDA